MDRPATNYDQQDPAGQTYTQITNDLLIQVLLELKACRLALTAIACNEKACRPQDFDPVQNPELQNG